MATIQVMFLNIGRFKESDFAGGTLVTGNRVSGNLFGGTSASLSWWSRQFYEAFGDYADHGLFAGKPSIAISKFPRRERKRPSALTPEPPFHRKGPAHDGYCMCENYIQVRNHNLLSTAQND
jgi:hypothetical protein